MKRKYPAQPMVGVGVLIKRGNSILLVKRSNNPGRGLWSIPGGVLELGETLEEAAVREAKEETGADISVDRLLDIYNLIENDDSGRIRYHYILINFLAHHVRGELKANAESSEIRWVKINELNSYQTTKTLRRLLKKLVKTE
jgi:8-oxo-dGTP diphosphatase